MTFFSSGKVLVPKGGDSAIALDGRAASRRRRDTEHTDFAIGAAYAFALGLLCWAAIGVGVYELISF